jgi:hypothetical protein
LSINPENNKTNSRTSVVYEIHHPSPDEFGFHRVAISSTEGEFLPPEADLIILNIFQYKIKCFSPEGRKATLIIHSSSAKRLHSSLFIQNPLKINE